MRSFKKFSKWHLNPLATKKRGQSYKKRTTRTLQTHDMIHKTLWTGQRSSSQVHSMYQHAHPPDCGWDCVAAALLDLDWHQPCLLAWSKKVFPFQVRLLQSSETVPDNKKDAYIRGFFFFFFLIFNFAGKEIIICCHYVN